MAKFFNRVAFATATTGQGTVNVGAALSAAFMTPAEAGAVNGDQVIYLLTEGNDFEIGYGTFTDASPDTISRATVIRSKIAGVVDTAKMDLAGGATVRLVESAEAFDAEHIVFRSGASPSPAEDTVQEALDYLYNAAALLAAAKAPLDSPALTGNPTAPTQSQADNSTKLATTAYVRAAIAAVLNGVSSAFDTLAEIAAGFLPLAGGTMTGNISFSGSQTVDGRDVSADGTKLDSIETNADVTDAANIASSIVGASGKTTPVDADTVPLIDSEASSVLKELTWANLKAGIWTALGALIAGGTSKTTPAGGDEFAIADSAASSATKRLSWTNILAALTALYQGLGKSALNAQTGTTYTFALADAGKTVTLSNASGITLTVPPNGTIAFPVDTRIDAIQTGAGQVTIAPGAGVTLRSKAGNLKISAQYVGVSFYKIATNEWVVTGDLSA